MEFKLCCFTRVLPDVDLKNLLLTKAVQINWKYESETFFSEIFTLLRKFLVNFNIAGVFQAFNFLSCFEFVRINNRIMLFTYKFEKLVQMFDFHELLFVNRALYELFPIRLGARFPDFSLRSSWPLTLSPGLLLFDYSLEIKINKMLKSKTLKQWTFLKWKRRRLFRLCTGKIQAIGFFYNL